MHPGESFALPQSPQTYKQLLMISGYDRYFQIVKCFRDEDLRADRQPEFTQIDIEMSFVREEHVMGIAEALTREMFSRLRGIELPDPFPQLTYAEAMDRFGSDKPDLRFGLELKPIAEAAQASEFKVFHSVLQSGGQVKGINAKGCSIVSRSQVDDLIAFAQDAGAKGTQLDQAHGKRAGIFHCEVFPRGGTGPAHRGNGLRAGRSAAICGR